MITEHVRWTSIQHAVQPAVVQIIAHIIPFNWLEPYKSDKQYEGRGSGFFIDGSGYVITAAHIVHQAKNIWIHAPEFGRQPIHVELVSLCPERDLALLRVLPNQWVGHAQPPTFTALSLGDSDAIAYADEILVISYPLGQARSKSTVGVISGYESIDSRSLIQLTAPVAPGSSGGPMINTQGQVIGIAIAAAHPANNISYAIPINELLLIKDELLTSSLVRKPYLGGRFIASGDEKAQFFNNPVPAGLYVGMVLKGSLLDQAGIKANDMLYEFNGLPIDAYGEVLVPWSPEKLPLHDLVNRVGVGQDISLIAYRSGTRIEATIPCAITSLPVRLFYPDFEPVGYEVFGGIVFMQLADNHLPLLISTAPELAWYLFAEHKQEPVIIITHILPGSSAYELRTLVPGTVITAINDQPVSTLADLRAAFEYSLKTGFVTIRTAYDILIVFSLDKLLAQEAVLARLYAYPRSSIMHQLQRAASILG